MCKGRHLPSPPGAGIRLSCFHNRSDRGSKDKRYSCYLNEQPAYAIFAPVNPTLLMHPKLLLAETILYPERSSFPVFKAGDTIRVALEIQEGEKKRVQKLEGVVLQIRGASYASRTFTLKKESHGVNIFFTLPMASPRILDIEVLQKGLVRRARLFYLKTRKGKAARVKHAKTDHRRATKGSASESAQ